MLLWVLVLGSAVSVAPADEFRDFVNEGELAINDEKFLRYIVPSGYSPQKLHKHYVAQLSDIVDKDNKHYKEFTNFIEKGYTMKGLTFNLYDDNMRNAAITLYRLLQDVSEENFQKMIEWASENINKDMFEYAWRLTSLYRNKFSDKELQPPFLSKPNYYVNTETINKAFRLKVKNGLFNREEAKVNQFYRTDNVISINTNYSGWNLEHNGCEEELDYFREDISINSYYYGIHLLHPFWMSNEELDEMNPRNAEHYYFAHQQLMSRYLLEKEHLKFKNVSIDNKDCQSSYNPYLSYDNGLPFPSRLPVKRGKWNEERNRLTSIHYAIKECISRGLIVMDNGTAIKMSEDNHIELLSKLIRANLDGITPSKIIRSLYGSNGCIIDGYMPAPSVLHHPETLLRDPLYWYLIQCMLNYFYEFKNTMTPYNLSTYQTNEFNISSHHFSKIVTYFQYYQFNINEVLGDDSYLKSPLVFTARQKRLKHLPFTLNFTIESKSGSDGIVRLFLGPQCDMIDCWKYFNRFYELDNFYFNFERGQNYLSWSTERSKSYSFDDYFNIELSSIKENRYNVFKFPSNLVIPKGLTEGLNLTLFIIVTPADNSTLMNFNPESNHYSQISYEIESKPLGFPFHRRALTTVSSAANYKFYNITIFHKRNPIDKSGYFSLHLY